MACFRVLVIGLLSDVLFRALNPKASLKYTFSAGFPSASGVENDYLDPIEWLPQNYDRALTTGVLEVSSHRVKLLRLSRLADGRSPIFMPDRRQYPKVSQRSHLIVAVGASNQCPSFGSYWNIVAP